jgi:hypothetical protein
MANCVRRYKVQYAVPQSNEAEREPGELRDENERLKKPSLS